MQLPLFVTARELMQDDDMYFMESESPCNQPFGGWVERCLHEAIHHCMLDGVYLADAIAVNDVSEPLHVRLEWTRADDGETYARSFMNGHHRLAAHFAYDPERWVAVKFADEKNPWKRFDTSVFA